MKRLRKVRSGPDIARLTIAPLFVLRAGPSLAAGLLRASDAVCRAVPARGHHPDGYRGDRWNCRPVHAARSRSGGRDARPYAVCVYPANIPHAVQDLSTGTGLGCYHYPRLFARPLICWWALAAGGRPLTGLRARADTASVHPARPCLRIFPARDGRVVTRRRQQCPFVKRYLLPLCLGLAATPAAQKLNYYAPCIYV